MFALHDNGFLAIDGIAQIDAAIPAASERLKCEVPMFLEQIAR